MISVIRDRIVAATGEVRSAGIISEGIELVQCGQRVVRELQLDRKRVL